jgi:hypothetical protein
MLVRQIRELLGKAKGGSMSLFVAGLALFAAAQAAADDSDWASAVLREMKNAEQQVQSGRVRVASLGNASYTPSVDRPSRSRSSRSPSSEDRPSRSLSGGSVNWIASSGCLNGTLRSVVSGLASNYGPVTVNSTCRSAGHNRRVGGAPRSLHLSGDAVDFRIHSNVSAAYASLRSNGSVGGLKHYGGGLFHIDTGSRRSW